MKNTLTIITLVIFFIPLICFANVFDTGTRITINSAELAEKRTLQILLPENYQANLTATYPVIYLLDGDYNFHGVSGMLDLLANKGQLIPNVILVGLADKGTETYRKYMTPNDSSSPIKGNKGAAKSFLDFLNNEVQPYMKKHYRTAEHSTLVGHSIGGLFVLNALIETPSAFDNYVAISPSVWVSDNAIVKKAQDKLGKTQHEKVSLYLALGDETRMGQYAFIDQLDNKALKNIDWHFKHYPDENHNSVALIALRDSLKTIFKGWHLQEKIVEGFEPEKTLQHYANIQDSLGLQQPIPASIVHVMIRQHYRQKIADALPAFIKNAVERFPESKQLLIAKQASFVGYYDSPESALSLLKNVETEFANSIEHMKAIASIYEQLKDNASAQDYYKKALTLAQQQKVNQWQVNIIQAKLL